MNFLFPNKIQRFIVVTGFYDVSFSKSKLHQTMLKNLIVPIKEIYLYETFNIIEKTKIIEDKYFITTIDLILNKKTFLIPWIKSVVKVLLITNFSEKEDNLVLAELEKIKRIFKIHLKAKPESNKNKSYLNKNIKIFEFKWFPNNKDLSFKKGI